MRVTETHTSRCSSAAVMHMFDLLQGGQEVNMRSFAYGFRF